MISRAKVGDLLSHPNTLTLYRILVVPGIVVLMMTPNRICAFVSALLFSAAAITDYFDGYLARKNKQVSDVGKLMDPFADALARSTVLISIAMAGFDSRWRALILPMVMVIIYNFLTSAYIRMAAIKRGKVIAARISGKIKAVVQGIGSLLILIGFVVQKSLIAAGMKPEVHDHVTFAIIYWSIMGLKVWDGNPFP